MKNTNTKGTINTYIEYFSLHNDSPKSIYLFDKNNDFKEICFFQYIKPHETVEESIFTEIFQNTIDALSRSYKYEYFDSRDKLLSFYYIFFELLTTNKNYLLLFFNNNTDKKNTSFDNFKINFLKYTSNLGLRTLRIEHSNSKKNKSQKSSWEEFLTVFDYWLKDSSKQLEKTAVFIHETIGKTTRNKIHKESFVERHNLLYR